MVVANTESSIHDNIVMHRKGIAVEISSTAYPVIYARTFENFLASPWKIVGCQSSQYKTWSPSQVQILFSHRFTSWISCVERNSCFFLNKGRIIRSFHIANSLRTANFATFCFEFQMCSRSASKVKTEHAILNQIWLPAPSALRDKSNDRWRKFRSISHSQLLPRIHWLLATNFDWPKTRIPDWPVAVRICQLERRPPLELDHMQRTLRPGASPTAHSTMQQTAPVKIALSLLIICILFVHNSDAFRGGIGRRVMMKNFHRVSATEFLSNKATRFSDEEFPQINENFFILKKNGKHMLALDIYP